MKKLLYLLLLVPSTLFSQSILNGNFETWITTPYDALHAWHNSNTESVAKTGLISATKTTDSQNGFAIKLETVSNGTDTSGGYVVNTDGDPIAGQGGFPYSQMPTNITGYYKYNIPANDTALLLIIFKSGGTIVSTDLFTIKGTGQQLTYTSFSYPLSLSVTPDTVIVAAASSNLVSGQGIEPGSTLYLDQISFTGSVAMPVLNNADFELWSIANFDQLTGWDYTKDGNSLGKTSDSYQGNYALKMESINSGSNPEVASITNGVFAFNGSQGGQPFANQIDTLFGYYKYFNTGGDSAVVLARFYLNGINIGYNYLLLPPVPAYTYFQMPINLGVAPDTMLLDFQSSNYPFLNIGSGSALYIDEIQLSSAPLLTSINELLKKKSNSMIYPNPAISYLNITPVENLKGTCRIIIYDLTGNEIFIANFKMQTGKEIFTIDLKGFSPGMYSYSILNEKYFSNGKFIKQ